MSRSKKSKMVCSICNASLALSLEDAHGIPICCRIPTMTEGFYEGLRSGVFRSSTETPIDEAVIDVHWGIAIVWATHNLFMERFEVNATLKDGNYIASSRNVEFDEFGNLEIVSPLSADLFQDISLGGTMVIDSEEEEFQDVVAFLRIMASVIGWDGVDSKLDFFVYSDVLSSEILDIGGQTLERIVALVDEQIGRIAFAEKLWALLLQKCHEGQVFDKAKGTEWHEMPFQIEADYKWDDLYSETVLLIEMERRHQNEMNAYRLSIRTGQKSPFPFSRVNDSSNILYFEMNWDELSEEALEGEDIQVDVSELIEIAGSVKVRAESATEAEKIFRENLERQFRIEEIEYSQPEWREDSEHTKINEIRVFGD